VSTQAETWGADLTLRTLTTHNHHYLRAMFTPEQLLAVGGNTAISGVGLSFLKLDDQLKGPKAVAFSLQGCALKNSARAASVAIICDDCDQHQRAGELKEATLTVKRVLNLLRSPLRHTGLELTGQSFSEAKIYLQTNIKDEHLVDGQILHSPSNLDDDLRVVGDLSGVLHLEADKACAMTASVRHAAGLGLDMVGLDLRQDGRIELKLYFAPPEGVEGLSGSTGYVRAERALFALHAASKTYIQPQSWAALKEIMSNNPSLCLNQISAEMQPSGLMKSKLYFDLWKRKKTFDADQSATYFSFEALEGLREAFGRPGLSFPARADLQNLKEAAEKGEFVLDAFCLETLGEATKIKIYVRPAGNTDGDGMTWDGGYQ
jgi:hypothetical protein